MTAPELDTPTTLDTRERWREFTAQPLHHVHRARLLACFDGLDLPAATLEAMLTLPRLQARLTRMLERRFALQPLHAIAPPQPADLPVATLGAAHLSELAERCGAVFWAQAFVCEIRAPAVRALREHFGSALYELALAERELACPDLALPTCADALAAAVQRDGQACVQAWLAEQPRALAAWQRLKLTAATMLPLSADVQRYGPAIVRRVVQLNTLTSPGGPADD